MVRERCAQCGFDYDLYNLADTLSSQRVFADRDFNRMLHDRNPGFSRLYAIPLSSATVTTGDVVMVEPTS